MNNILLLGFDFSVAKLTTPLVIIGLVLMILSIFLVGGSSKLDELIVKKVKAKRKAKRSDAQNIDTLGILDAKSSEAETSENREETLDNADDITVKDRSRLMDNEVNEDGELSMFRRKNGIVNYYFIFKVIGLVGVIASAFMIIFGMK